MSIAPSCSSRLDPASQGHAATQSAAPPPARRLSFGAEDSWLQPPGSPAAGQASSPASAAQRQERAQRITAEIIRCLQERKQELKRHLFFGPDALSKAEWQCLRAPLRCAIDLLQGPEPQRVWRWDPLRQWDPGSQQGEMERVLVGRHGVALWQLLRPEYEEAWHWLIRAAPLRREQPMFQIEDKGSSGNADLLLTAGIEQLASEVIESDRQGAFRIADEGSYTSIRGQLRAHPVAGLSQALSALQAQLLDPEGEISAYAQEGLLQCAVQLALVGDLEGSRAILGRLSGFDEPERVEIHFQGGCWELRMEDREGWQLEEGAPLMDRLQQAWRSWIAAGLRCLRRPPETLERGRVAREMGWVLEQPGLGHRALRDALEEATPDDLKALVRDLAIALPAALTPSARIQMASLQRLLKEAVQQLLTETEAKFVQEADEQLIGLVEVLRGWGRSLENGATEGVLDDLVAWQRAWDQVNPMRHRAQASIWKECFIAAWVRQRILISVQHSREGSTISFFRLRQLLKPFESALAQQLAQERLGSLAPVERVRRLALMWLVRASDLSVYQTAEGRARFMSARSACSTMAMGADDLLRAEKAPEQAAASLDLLESQIAALLDVPELMDEELAQGLAEVKLTIQRTRPQLVERLGGEDHRRAFRSAELQSARRMELAAAVHYFGPREAALLLAKPMPGSLKALQCRSADPAQQAELVQTLVEQAIEVEAFAFAGAVFERIASHKDWMPPCEMLVEGPLLGVICGFEALDLEWDAIDATLFSRDWQHQTARYLLHRLFPLCSTGNRDGRQAAYDLVRRLLRLFPDLGSDPALPPSQGP